MMIVHQKAFHIPKIGLTGMGIWIIQITAGMTGRQTMNPICNWATAVKIQNPRSGGILGLH
jgi:hypothetical protein